MKSILPHLLGPVLELGPSRRSTAGQVVNAARECSCLRPSCPSSCLAAQGILSTSHPAQDGVCYNLGARRLGVDRDPVWTHCIGLSIPVGHPSSTSRTPLQDAWPKEVIVMKATAAPIIFGLLALILQMALTQGQPDFKRSAQPSFTQGTEADHNRIVLKSKPPKTVPKASFVSKQLGIATVDISPEEDLGSTLNKLVEQVEYAVKDSLVWATAAPVGVPNDPEYRFQWGLTRVGAPASWKALEAPSAPQRVPGDTITVCVADSGVDVTQPDLAQNLHPSIGYNAIKKNANVSDGLKHGTHVAGIIAAIDNNGLAVAGVGADYVQVLTCKFLNDQGYGYASDAVACIDYCLENGADIITNSWSGGEDNPALRDAIQHSLDKDVLFVVAAGNTGSNLDLDTAYPASYSKEFPNMLVVASTDYKDSMSNFSNYGQNTVHLGAPGEWILSLVPNNDTAYYSGTSMAAPLVAGTAAIVQAAAGGKLTAKQLKDIILMSVEPLPSLQGKVASGGILRADKAVQAAVQQPTPARRRLVNAHRKISV